MSVLSPNANVWQPVYVSAWTGSTAVGAAGNTTAVPPLTDALGAWSLSSGKAVYAPGGGGSTPIGAALFAPAMYAPTQNQRGLLTAPLPIAGVSQVLVRASAAAPFNCYFGQLSPNGTLDVYRFAASDAAPVNLTNTGGPLFTPVPGQTYVLEAYAAGDGVSVTTVEAAVYTPASGVVLDASGNPVVISAIDATASLVTGGLVGFASTAGVVASGFEVDSEAANAGVLAAGAAISAQARTFPNFLVSPFGFRR